MTREDDATPAPAGGGFGTMRIEALADRIFVALARPTRTRDRAWAIVVRNAQFATVPALPMVAVFYNTRLALYLYFLLLVVHFLPGRVDLTADPEVSR